jgi:hypothetical protein
VEAATGLRSTEGNSTVLWRLENGGSQDTARAVISEDASSENPYEVRMEWVDGEGWKPTSVERLSSNQYN